MLHARWGCAARTDKAGFNDKAEAVAWLLL